MAPPIMNLHERFQRGIYKVYADRLNQNEE